MAYSIRHGNNGFAILDDGRVVSDGYTSRQAARAAIRENEKQTRTLEYAREALRKTCDALLEDGVSREQLLELLKIERDGRFFVSG